MGIKKTSHARYEIWYHITWGTKYRKKIFRYEDMREATERILREIAMHYDMEMKEIKVMVDHVH